MKKIAVLIILYTLTTLSSCKDAMYVMKSPNKHYKYAMAMKWNKEENYVQSIPVIENLLADYKGTDTGEQLYFILAESYFKNKDYIVAAYHYKTFKDLYSRNPNAELASMRLADCYKNEVPRLELEQSDTEKAIEYYNVFLSEYPNSSYTEQALTNLKSLKRRLELKALDAANLYYKTGNYRAAAVTYKNVLNKFPEIEEYEFLMYKITKSYYKFAEQSILSKQSNRYETTLNEGISFINRFPNSKYKAEILLDIENSKVKVLESALHHAHSYYKVEERPLYYNEAISLYNELIPEIKVKPSSITNYLDQCYLGILNSSFILIEETRDLSLRTQQLQLFKINYTKYINQFSKNSVELKSAEELYLKINQIKS